MAFPLTSRFLQLDYTPGTESLKVEFLGEHGADLKLLFYGVLDNALSRLNVKAPGGHFKVTSTLPVGTGLGASAALCGAVSRWCSAMQWIDESEVYEFARRLEDLFHLESSGVDLAVSLSARGIVFVRDGEQRRIEPKWTPKLYLSYCGRRGMTSDCVAKVKRIFDVDPEGARKIDSWMLQAVRQAEEALGQDASTGLKGLESAIRQAARCFEAWGLCNDDLTNHIRLLTGAGALVAKPTGSGGGGFVLSLWEERPPVSLEAHLIPAFAVQ